jgi:PilZ domain
MRKARASRKFRDATYTDQRRSTRYGLNLDLTYTVFERGKTVDTGSGRTIDCSSVGLRIVTDRSIEPGRKLELAVRWPLTLDGGIPLKLVVYGESIRADNDETAIRIVGYEFRTRALSDERREYQAYATHRLPLDRQNHVPLRVGAAAMA